MISSLPMIQPLIVLVPLFVNICLAFPPPAVLATSAERSIIAVRQVQRQQRLPSRTRNDLRYYQQLQLRGGSLATLSDAAPPSSTSILRAASLTTTSLESSVATSNSLAAAKTAVQKAERASKRRKYWRILTELGKHVWPALPSRQKLQPKSELDARSTIRSDISSDIYLNERKHALSMRYRVVLSILFMLAGKGVTIATPFLFKMLIDTIPRSGLSTATMATTVAETLPSLGPQTVAIQQLFLSPIFLLLSYGTCRSLSSLFRESTNAIFSQVAQSAIRSVGRSTFDHVHNLDLQYHLSRNTGALSRVLERGSRSISFALNAMVFNTIPTVLEVLVVSALMFRKFGLSHSFTVLLTIFLYSAFTIAVTQWRSAIRKDMNAFENQASGKISDSLLNYETIKYFTNELHEGQVYESTLHRYQNVALKAASSMSILNFGQNAIFSMGLTVIMYLTLRDMGRGLATAGDLVLVNGLLFQLSVPLNFIGWVYQEVRQAFIDMEAMFELWDTKSSVVDNDGAIQFDPWMYGTEIKFKDVEFAYNTSPSLDRDGIHHPLTHEEQLVSSRPILKKTSFTIPQGKTIAIVGSSGCGKSTLLRMLYRFYNPDNGSISIGGKDISSYTIESVRRAIAVVPQDVVLFNDSIGYNIQYGNLNASWEEVIEASKKAHLHEIIMKLPNGYNTVVGERGLKMSGGEKQRVSIARAILKKAPILLCDEPTSSLDMHTELEIMNNLKEIGKETTCLIIAHRLSTIQDCDLIVVMDNGRVIESGSHEDLVKQGGKYFELLAFQKSRHSWSEDEVEVESDDTILEKGYEVVELS